MKIEKTAHASASELHAREGRIERDKGPISGRPRKGNRIGPSAAVAVFQAASRDDRDYQCKCKVLHGDPDSKARRSPVVGDLGKNLRAARERLNLTQEAVADRSGVQAGEISRIERGKRDPQVSTVEKLADAVGLKPGQLLDGDGP